MNLKVSVFILISFCFLFACEEQFTPDVNINDQEIVVEGYIEAGDLNLPPYVILTRSQPFFRELDLANLNNFFVHDAVVEVSNGTDVAVLEEVCWDDFDPDEQELIERLLSESGIGDFDTIPGNLCVYIDLDFELLGEVGETYDLRIEVEDQVLTARTTIHNPVPIDTFRFILPEGEVPDTLRELRVIFQDPVDEVNFYRYFTSVNGGSVIPHFNSVADDALFNGQEFEFPLPKSESRSSTAGPTSFGLFTEGDSVVIKWTTIDESNFRFWSSLEFNAINQGPFSSYTRVDSNVEGGLGIWGAYAAIYYPMVVE